MWHGVGAGAGGDDEERRRPREHRTIVVAVEGSRAGDRRRASPGLLMAPSSGPDVGRGTTDRRTVVVLVVTVAVLALWDLGRIPLVPAERHLVFNVAMAAVFASLGALGGLDRAGFGLARSQVRKGLIYGGAVLAVVGAGLALVAIVPLTSDVLRDDRVLVVLPGMLFQVFVEIPLGTVLLEELAFRGTLLGLLRTRWSTPVAIAVSSGIFGLWHVAGVVDDSSGDAVGSVAAAVIGTVVATTAAGIGFAWLRVRSDSLLAPMLAHVATNSLPYAAAWLVSR